MDLLIQNVRIFDGSGAESMHGSVAIDAGRIVGFGDLSGIHGAQTFDGKGAVLSPGFIDTHTHDDLAAIDSPGMLAKLSQGVTTVVVGNCGICAAPASLKQGFPDPMNLLGTAAQFRYQTFGEYVSAVNAARPAVNVAALVGHTTLRNNHMDHLARTANEREISGMRAQLRDALSHGALGLSTGLAYLSAFGASTEEVMRLAEPLFEAGGIYTTHLRSEGVAILDALDEAFKVGRHARCPVLVSHLKCAGVDNWGRSDEVLNAIDFARSSQDVSCDCYPYSASSSTLDLRQVDPRVRIQITWSEPHPELAGDDLSTIAARWNVTHLEAAKRLQPAGAIYHGMSEQDVQQFLAHPATMIGSDGLPCDPRPHPRLWGTFPRVLGHYSRDLGLFSLATAIHKMTGLPANRFRLANRGLVKEGYHADLVLFDPEVVGDLATYDEPTRPSKGIEAVWVAGQLSYVANEATGLRVGGFVRRG